VSSCIFCDIVGGHAPASVVHSDDRCIAILDIQPVNPGHLLVIPRAHAARLADLDAADGAHLFRIAQRTAAALYRADDLRCEGVNLFLADGEIAGQEVFHVHLHVLPRAAGDGFGLQLPPGYADKPDRAALDAIAGAIRGALGGS
jgi:histidine triad (HIT) family protein